MEFFRILYGERIPFSLCSHRVEHHGLFQRAAAAQVLDDLPHVVPVDRPEIQDAELFKWQIRRKEAFEAVFELLHMTAQEIPEPARFQHAGERALERIVRAVGTHRRQRVLDAADVFRDRHLVVVENDQKRDPVAARVVQRFVGESSGHRAVADQSDRHAGFAVCAHGARKPERRGDRRAGMARIERVVNAFAVLRETGEPAFLPKRIERILAARQDLVHVRLMSDVKNELVRRTVEHVVHGDDQLDRAETGRKMTARFRYVLDQKRAQFLTKRRKLFFRKRFEIPYAVDRVKQRIAHFSSFCSVTHRQATEARLRPLRDTERAARERFVPRRR